MTTYALGPFRLDAQHDLLFRGAEPVAVGRAIRTSIVTVVVADFFLSFAIWGSTTTVRITG